MDTITHRELRNGSSEVLRRVAAGESFLVTNHGDPAALIGPPPASPWGRLVAAGHVRLARRQGGFGGLARAAETSSRDVLQDLRGDR